MGRRTALHQRTFGKAASEKEDCRWAAWRGDFVDEEAESLVDLPHDEQVSRGQELLGLLSDLPAEPSSASQKRSKRSAQVAAKTSTSNTHSSPEVLVIVKHTFIELVESQNGHRRRGARQRALTDSELFDGLAGVRSDDEKSPRWSSRAGAKSVLHGDLSDVSTDEPSSEDDAAALGAAAAAGPAEANLIGICTETSAMETQQDAMGLSMADGAQDACVQGQWPHQPLMQQQMILMRDDSLCAPQVLPQSLEMHGQCMEGAAMGGWWMPMGTGYEGGMQMVCAAPAPGDWHWNSMACSGPAAYDSVCGGGAYDATGAYDNAASAYDNGFSVDACASVPSGSAAAADSCATPGEFVAQDVDGERTTVMLRNLPNSYSRSMLLELIDAEGFGGSYDFVYLPVDFSSQAGLGYAFVNFISPADADRCQRHFEGFTRWQVPSEKVCSVTWAGPHQGLNPHVERYRNSPVMHESVPDEWKPAIFTSTGRIAFPPPTQPIRKPKIRRRPDGSTPKASAAA
jgi:hypothetical protein